MLIAPIGGGKVAAMMVGESETFRFYNEAKNLFRYPKMFYFSSKGYCTDLSMAHGPVQSQFCRPTKWNLLQ